MKLTNGGRRFARLALIMISGAALIAPAFAQSTSITRGVWARDDGQVRTRLASCGEAVCAVNTWVSTSDDAEKPGDRLIMTIQDNGPGHWTGSAYDPKRQLTYTVDMSVYGKRMTTRGCVASGLICKTVSWSLISR